MLTNCNNCEQAFNQGGIERLCPTCSITYYRLFAFVERNPEATLDEVERVLGLTRTDLVRLLKSGRFVAFKKLARQVLKCRSCGAPPAQGELCQSCFERLLAQLLSTNRPRL